MICPYYNPLGPKLYDADAYFMQASTSGNTAHMEAAAQLFINLRAMGADESHGSGGGILSNLDDILVKMSNEDKIIDTVTTNAEKGELAEALADVVMKRAGYDKLPSKIGSNNGFDGVYVKRDNSGNVQDIVIDVIINESKFGTSQLGKTKGGLLQMSPEWIDMNIKKCYNLKIRL